MADRYVKLDDVISIIKDVNWNLGGLIQHLKEHCPTADVVEVVRCKDCKHFQPCFVLTDDGERRPYTEEEIKNGRMVMGDVGINCSSRCERFGYWEENKIPVWYNENDFCSYGERR